LNPGPPAPQAGILDQTSLTGTRIAPNPDEETRLRPHTTDINGRIINTLLELRKQGLAENTLTSISASLRQLNQHADLNNPESVKEHIAEKNVANSTKTKLCFGYDKYCKVNRIPWVKPRYKWERKIPLIPSTQNIDKIISASTPKYATIFTILKETGLECCELADMTRNQIDTEQGIINAQGCKGHNSRSIKLKQKTADMLRTYLDKHTDEKPFPRSKAISNIWQRTRDKLADTLNEPQLKQIPLRNLRHYHATHLYDKTKDILLVKQRLGHKKIETTMFYTQLITFTDEEEYTVRFADTKEQAKDLIEHGFQYVNTIEGTAIYRKRK
jgi:integrase